eukprot:TRINITY_DN8855_c0_g1_i1.p1 TRINITY_DN8855_c0_g1~~TRINITY_DN8855_c0_g1_i1.p1  ORF type:complete len:207 (-),score=51.15 TRINITY_DN8855_c0_g1_i1:143-763(-)
METFQVLTTDEEEIEISPAERDLLQLVQEQNGIQLPIDSLTFDLVLRYLSDKSKEIPAIEATELKIVAEKLKLDDLKSRCESSLTPFQRVKEFTWEEFCKHQQPQDFWMLLDGKVYDISSWISPHPISKAIPHPGLLAPLECYKKDASYQFEIYHSSNESFYLLKNFFIGVLQKDQLALVPSSRHIPSQEFYEHLRSFTRQFVSET